MISTLLFDLDDTLYDQAQPFKEALRQTVPEIPLPQDMSPLYCRFRHHCDEIFVDYSAGRIALNESQSVRIRHFYQEVTGKELSRSQAERFQSCYEHELAKISLSQEMISLLRKLAETNLTLGIISNGPTAHQWKKVRQLGLQEWFPQERIWISGEVGIAKPNPDIFKIVQKKLGVEAEEILYIGDSFKNDIAATAKVGWQSIWFNHRQRALPVGYQENQFVEQIVYTVSELSQRLFKIL